MKEPGGTLVIDNFAGRLTRASHGPVNSGFAKFDTSWGYNPFFDPGNLTWFKAANNITASIDGVVLAATSRVEGTTNVTYAITSTGHLMRLTGDGGGQSDIRTLSTGSPTFTYGADIVFFGVANTLYISHDLGVTKIVINGSGSFVSEAQVGTWSSTQFTPITSRRSMAEFLGKLYVTNSDASVTYANNIAEIIAAGTVSSYAKLSPSLPAGTYIRDLDISSDLTYLEMTASLVPSELIAPVNDAVNYAPADSSLYKWNGLDAGVTTGAVLPGFGVSALQNFGQSDWFFMNDAQGAALYESATKRITLRNQKLPFPGATASAGNFITWANPDFYWNLDTGSGAIYGSLYYYGQMDEDSPRGLWRVNRQSSLIGGVIYSMPYMGFITSRYVSVNTSATIQVDQNGVQLYSFIDYSGSGGATNNHLFSFLVSPPDDSPGGWTGPVAGVYETQTQLFSEKIKITQARVYTNATIANNQFSFDLIGPNGKKITNTDKSYTFAAGSDPTLLQGAQDRINFNYEMGPTYGVGVRVTNAGSTNMTFNKIELDWVPAGK